MLWSLSSLHLPHQTHLILLSPQHLYRTGDFLQVWLQLNATAVRHQLMQQFQVEVVAVFPQVHGTLQDLIQSQLYYKHPQRQM